MAKITQLSSPHSDFLGCECYTEKEKGGGGGGQGNCDVESQLLSTSVAMSIPAWLAWNALAFFLGIATTILVIQGMSGGGFSAGEILRSEWFVGGP